MDEVLFTYIVVASHAVSLVLIQVDSGMQRSVYYVSKSLHEAKFCYLPLEKAILAVVHATRKLPYYFHSSYFNPTSASITISEHILHWKGGQVGNNPRGF